MNLYVNTSITHCNLPGTIECPDDIEERVAEVLRSGSPTEFHPASEASDDHLLHIPGDERRHATYHLLIYLQAEELIVQGYQLEGSFRLKVYYHPDLPLLVEWWPYDEVSTSACENDPTLFNEFRRLRAA